VALTSLIPGSGKKVQQLFFSMRFFLACLFPVFCLSPSLRADEFSALVTGTSNYFYRGYSKSGNAPTVRANVDYAHSSGFFGGLWISRVDFQDKAYSHPSNVEFYPYVGYSYKLADQWRLDGSVARYAYDGRLFGKSSDYNEYSASVHYSDILTARVDFANDAYNRGGATVNYEISGRYPLGKSLSISAGLGLNQASDVIGYDWLYWNTGISWFFKYGALDLRYVDTAELSSSEEPNGLEFPQLKNRFVFSLTVGF
jgi:uncharacterized protein (TIGR02001 family)